MKRTISAFTLVAALLAAAGSGTLPATADAAAQSASGFGQTHLGLAFRNFAFSATKRADGTVTGQAQLYRQDLGVLVHIELDCLHARGNLAVVSGVVTSTNSATLPVGIDELFVVKDNGDGPDAPADEITLVFDGLGLACTDLPPDPAFHAPFLFPIEHGQIQVRA